MFYKQISTSFRNIFYNDLEISVKFQKFLWTTMTVTLAVTAKILAAKLTETIANIYKDLGKI